MINYISIFVSEYSLTNIKREKFFLINSNYERPLVVSLSTFGMIAQAGNLGGQIRHTEIRDTSNEIYEPEGFDAEEEDNN